MAHRVRMLARVDGACDNKRVNDVNFVSVY